MSLSKTVWFFVGLLVLRGAVYIAQVSHEANLADQCRQFKQVRMDRTLFTCTYKAYRP